MPEQGHSGALGNPVLGFCVASRSTSGHRGLKNAYRSERSGQSGIPPELGVLEEDVEVSVVVEHSGVDQLVLELVPRPVPVRLQEVPVGNSLCGYL